MDLNPVEARITYECLDTTCNIGETEIVGNTAKLTADFPACVNGFVIAQAENYTTGKTILSTNSQREAFVLLKRLHNLDIDLRIGGISSDELAIINFVGEESKTVAWPQVKSVSLAEGYYNMSVYVYRNSSLRLPASQNKKCVEVPSPGVLGFFGATREQCFDLSFPEQTISSSINAGGKSTEYFLEEELVIADRIILDVPSLPTPTSLEQIQDNFILLENKLIDVRLE